MIIKCVVVFAVVIINKFIVVFIRCIVALAVVGLGLGWGLVSVTGDL